MSVADDIVALIDRDEIARFALEICNIDSPYGYERDVANRHFQLDGARRPRRPKNQSAL